MQNECTGCTNVSCVMECVYFNSTPRKNCTYLGSSLLRSSLALRGALEGNDLALGGGLLGLGLGNLLLGNGGLLNRRGLGAGQLDHLGRGDLDVRAEFLHLLGVLAVLGILLALDQGGTRVDQVFLGVGDLLDEGGDLARGQHGRGLGLDGRRLGGRAQRALVAGASQLHGTLRPETHALQKRAQKTPTTQLATPDARKI
jgi:hypothetical protein